MRSKARASWPSSSEPRSTTGSSKFPAAIRSAARSSRRIRRANRLAPRVAEEDREARSRARRRCSTRRRTTLDGLELVVQRGREQHAPSPRPIGLARPRRTRWPVPGRRCPAPARARRAATRAIGSSSTSRRVAGRGSSRRSARAGGVGHVEDDRRARRRAGADLVRVQRPQVELGRERRQHDRAAATSRGCSSSWFSSERLVGRDDDHVDDREHARDDHQQREREPAADAPEGAHRVAEAVADAADRQDVLRARAARPRASRADAARGRRSCAGRGSRRSSRAPRAASGG